MDRCTASRRERVQLRTQELPSKLRKHSRNSLFPSIHSPSLPYQPAEGLECCGIIGYVYHPLRRTRMKSLRGDCLLLVRRVATFPCQRFSRNFPAFLRLQFSVSLGQKTRKTFRQFEQYSTGDASFREQRERVFFFSLSIVAALHSPPSLAFYVPSPFAPFFLCLSLSNGAELPSRNCTAVEFNYVWNSALIKFDRTNPRVCYWSLPRNAYKTRVRSCALRV